MKDKIKQLIDSSVEVKQKVADHCVNDIEAVAEACIQSLEAGGKILFCGNGGSAADSQHLAAELVGRFQKERLGIASIALTTDTSILTAIGNDYGFDAIFTRQIEALGSAGDILVGISTSGNSVNIVNAYQQAKAQQMKVIAFVGRDGGQMAREADLSVVVPSNVTARIQEAHICVGHILCELIEDHFA